MHGLVNEWMKSCFNWNGQSLGASVSQCLCGPDHWAQVYSSSLQNKAQKTKQQQLVPQADADWWLWVSGPFCEIIMIIVLLLSIFFTKLRLVYFVMMFCLSAIFLPFGIQHETARFWYALLTLLFKQECICLHNCATLVCLLCCISISYGMYFIFQHFAPTVYFNQNKLNIDRRERDIC